MTELTAPDLAARFQTLERLHHDVENPPEVLPDPGGARTSPGPRVPPGVQEILAQDETQRALEASRELVSYVRRVILDESGHTHAPSTLAGAEVILGLEDELLVLAIDDDLAEATAGLRAITRRYERIIQTGHRCLDFACKGRYVVPEREGKTSEDLICTGCSDRVPFEVWHTWPPATVTWLTPEQAAERLGVSVNTVRIRASRGKWRKTGIGREVKYHIASMEGSRA